MPRVGVHLRAVLFDLDDTLNDRPQSWLAFVEHLARAPDGPLAGCDPRPVHRAILAADEGGYRPKDLLFADLQRLPWRTPHSAARVEALWREHFPACTVVRPAVAGLLTRLTRLGVRRGVVTNGRDDNQRAKLRCMGLLGRLDAVVTSGHIGVKKPDPALYLAATKALGVRPADVLFVGDHPVSDIVGPARLGMRTAWLAHGRSWPLPDVRPDHTLLDLADLHGVLDTITGDPTTA